MFKSDRIKEMKKSNCYKDLEETKDEKEEDKMLRREVKHEQKVVIENGIEADS